MRCCTIIDAAMSGTKKRLEGIFVPLFCESGILNEAGAGLDAVVRVAKLGIVFIAAGADVFIHVVLLKKAGAQAAGR